MCVFGDVCCFDYEVVVELMIKVVVYVCQMQCYSVWIQVDCFGCLFGIVFGCL